MKEKLLRKRGKTVQTKMNLKREARKEGLLSQSKLNKQEMQLLLKQVSKVWLHLKHKDLSQIKDISISHLKA